MPELDPLVHAFYQRNGFEEHRLDANPVGRWECIRTWDLLADLLPASGRVLDVGGGPGVHAAHLARHGYEVTLVDPVPLHVEQAAELAATLPSNRFACNLGDARMLEADDETYDAVLLMGPLYHLHAREERLQAWREARRVLRPGGVVVAQAINRTAWILDATVSGRLSDDGIFEDFAINLSTGASARRSPVEAAAAAGGGGFWAYFHRPDEFRDECTAAGFDEVQLRGVEGFAWMAGNFEALLGEQLDLLRRATRLIEADPFLLGASEHLLVAARRAIEPTSP